MEHSVHWGKDKELQHNPWFPGLAPDQGMRNEEVGFQMQKEEELPEDMS